MPAPGMLQPPKQLPYFCSEENIASALEEKTDSEKGMCCTLVDWFFRSADIASQTSF